MKPELFVLLTQNGRKPHVKDLNALVFENTLESVQIWRF
jgi:hypothetical protein